MDRRRDKSKVRFLNFDEFEHLSRIPKEQRDELIISILYETGCTVNELAHIRNSHFDLESNRLKITREHARNQSSRLVYISEGLARKVREFCKNRPDQEYLFYTRQGKSITTKRIRQIVQNSCRQAKIRDAGPQVLRYTHIFHAYMKNIPLDAIQKQVGLKRSRAIEIFGQLPEMDQKDAYKRFLM